MGQQGDGTEPRRSYKQSCVISCGYLCKFIPPIWTRLNGHFSAMNYLKPIMKTHGEWIQGNNNYASVYNDEYLYVLDPWCGGG